MTTPDIGSATMLARVQEASAELTAERFETLVTDILKSKGLEDNPEHRADVRDMLHAALRHPMSDLSPSGIEPGPHTPSTDGHFWGPWWPKDKFHKYRICDITGCGATEEQETKG